MEGEGTRKSPNATLEQTAKFLQLSTRSVQNYQDRGLLKPIYFGRRRFFRCAEVEKLARHGAQVVHAG